MSDNPFRDHSPYEPPQHPNYTSGVGPQKGPMGLTNDDRTYGMLCHLLGPLTGFIGPLIIWLIKKDESPFVDDQGKESLNFQLTMLIGMMASGALTLVCIGYFMLLALIVVDWVFGIMGCIAANKGEAYRYPINIRMIN